MTTKDIPSCRWVQLTVTMEPIGTNTLNVKLYVGMDESFQQVVMLGQKPFEVKNHTSTARLTKIMDKSLGKFAEIALWNHTMDIADILKLYK